MRAACCLVNFNTTVGFIKVGTRAAHERTGGRTGEGQLLWISKVTVVHLLSYVLLQSGSRVFGKLRKGGSVSLRK